MSDQVDYTDGNYVSLSIEELPYERIDENDYHLKLDSMGLKGNDEFPLEDAVPLLVPLVASIPKTKRRRVKKTKELVKKKSKKIKRLVVHQSWLLNQEPLVLSPASFYARICHGGSCTYCQTSALIENQRVVGIKRFS